MKMRAHLKKLKVVFKKGIFAQSPSSHRRNSAARSTVFSKLGFIFTKHKFIFQNTAAGPAQPRSGSAGWEGIYPRKDKSCPQEPLEGDSYGSCRMGSAGGSPWGVPSLLVPRPSRPGSPHPAPPSAELRGTPHSLR